MNGTGLRPSLAYSYWRDSTDAEAEAEPVLGAPEGGQGLGDQRPLASISLY